MDVVLSFVGALAGAVIGAYAGVTAERLRGKHELALRRREDIKDGVLALHLAATTALTACQALATAERAPRSEASMSRLLKAREGRAAATMEAFERVELLLPPPSDLPQTVFNFIQVLRSQAVADPGMIARFAVPGETQAEKIVRQVFEAADEERRDDGQFYSRQLERARVAHSAVKGAIRIELQRL